jgi:hypothetical protein
MAVGVDHDPASYLNVFDGGCGIAFNELGFAVKLHGFGRPVAGLYGNRVVGDRSDRSHNVFHAAVSEDQSAEKQRAN